jgi:HNH endonuclease
VDRLVLEAFDRPKPPGMRCRHLDGDPGNNRYPENICWGTHTEEEADKLRLARGRNQYTGDRPGPRALGRQRIAELRAMTPEERAAELRRMTVSGEQNGDQNPP